MAIIDVNRLGQSEETSLGHNIEAYRRRADAFGYVKQRATFLSRARSDEVVFTLS